MRAFAVLVMKGRFHAITATAVCGTLSLMMPPLTYVSGAVVALATLRQGHREGAIVVAGALVLSAAFSMLLMGTPVPALVFTLVSWGPAWLMGVVLNARRAQGSVLVCATGLGLLAVVVLHLLYGDPSTWWRQVMGQFFAPIMEGNPESAKDLEQIVNLWAPRMTRFFGAATVLGLMVTLLLARYWHAALDNPGAFGSEFRALRVGRGALLLTLGLGALTLLIPDVGSGLVGDLMGPLIAMLVFQGLAVVHDLVKRRKASVGWLVMVYILLIMPPHVALPVLSLLGLTDGWIDFRGRVPEKTT